MEKHEIRLEYSMLQQPLHCPTGVYVMPSTSDIHVWHGTLFVREGLYAGAVFRFLLTIPPTFPNSTQLPAVYILSECFHPLVDPDGGRFDIRSRFAGGRWKAHHDHIADVLRFVKESFRKSNIVKVTQAQASNKEAWRVFHQQPALYESAVRQSVKQSTAPSALYDFSNQSIGRRAGKDQPFAFKRLSNEEFEAMRERIRVAHGVGAGGRSSREGSASLGTTPLRE